MDFNPEKCHREWCRHHITQAGGDGVSACTVKKCTYGKPVIEMVNATLVGSGLSMVGHVQHHHYLGKQTSMVWTSMILKHDKETDMVETVNTMYKVLSWAGKGDRVSN